MKKVLSVILIGAVVIGIKFYPAYERADQQIEQGMRSVERMKEAAKEVEDRQTELESSRQRLLALRKEKLLGRWEDVKNSAHNIHFAKDGQFSTAIPGMLFGQTLIRGQYRIVDNDTIEFTGEGVKAQWDYNLSEDKLELRAPNGEWERFKRSD